MWQDSVPQLVGWWVIGNVVTIATAYIHINKSIVGDD
jgi:hypothetical protein